MAQQLTDIVVFGAGGHAKVVAQSLRRAGCWRVVGFIDDMKAERAGEVFAGAQVLGGRAALGALRRSGVDAITLAFGNNRARLELAAALAQDGWRFPPILDPQANVAEGVELGEGCYIAAGAIVEPGAAIGSQTIVNTATVVCHDSRVGAGVHLCPRVCLGGHVKVGNGVWIGLGAVVRDRVSIGDGALIGAGSLVLHDVARGMVAYGLPARSVRKVS